MDGNGMYAAPKQDGSHIVRGTKPPGAGPAYRIVQLKAGCEVEGVILGEQVWGVLCHWNSRAGKRGRSERCTRDDDGGCDGCEKGLPVRWKGYLHYFDAHLASEAFLEITPGAFERLERESPRGTTLRGLRIKVKRGSANTAPLRIELGLYAGNMEALPAPRDPEPFMRQLWDWGR